jgi:hypothetical protein
MVATSSPVVHPQQPAEAAELVDSDGVAAGERTFAAGDRVVCLRNDRRLGVHNALFASVTAATPDRLVLRSEADGRRINLPLGCAADGHLDHAWATTIHKAQGATYGHALLLGDRLYRQAGYTGLSRAARSSCRGRRTRTTRCPGTRGRHPGRWVRPPTASAGVGGGPPSPPWGGGAVPHRSVGPIDVPLRRAGGIGPRRHGGVLVVAPG